MSVLNFGSLNVDHVYRVDNFVQPGETIRCQEYHRFAGGKGLNQSIALSHAGARVAHAGKIGESDVWLKTMLQTHGVETEYIETVDGPSGHAIIQVNSDGENSIVIFGGANENITQPDVEITLSEFSHRDYLLLQNEVNAIPEIIFAAKQQGMIIAFNPAPMTAQVLNYPLELVDILFVNEIEANDLTGETNPQKICSVLLERFPKIVAVLTLGAKGAIYKDAKQEIFEPAEKTNAVDTTAAGDTFIGFFLAEFIRTSEPTSALKFGCQAAALCVTRLGSANSIPHKNELNFKQKQNSCFTPLIQF